MEILKKAETLVAAGNYDQAITLLTKAISDQYLRAQALRTRGHLYYELRKFDKSIADYTDAISTKAPGITGVESAHFFRGRAAIANGNYSLALDDLHWLLDHAIKCDSDGIEDVCELIEEALNRTSDIRMNIQELDRIRKILEFLAKTFFPPGEPGHSWSTRLLGELNASRQEE